MWETIVVAAIVALACVFVAVWIRRRLTSRRSCCEDCPSSGSCDRKSEASERNDTSSE